MIAPGDVVMVVKPAPCCGSVAALGLVFTVKVVRIARRIGCVHCARVEPIVAVVELPDTGLVVEVFRLKKLPPLTPGEVTHEIVALKLDKRRGWSHAA